MTISRRNRMIAEAIINRIKQNSGGSTWNDEYPGAHDELFGFYYEDLAADAEAIINEHTVIRENKEQEQAAKDCGKKFCCLAYHGGIGWTWYVALATDSMEEADRWCAKQEKMARVYYNSGRIRHAK